MPYFWMVPFKKRSSTCRCAAEFRPGAEKKPDRSGWPAGNPRANPASPAELPVDALAAHSGVSRNNPPDIRVHGAVPPFFPGVCSSSAKPGCVGLLAMVDGTTSHRFAPAPHNIRWAPGAAPTAPLVAGLTGAATGAGVVGTAAKIAVDQTVPARIQISPCNTFPFAMEVL